MADGLRIYPLNDSQRNMEMQMIKAILNNNRFPETILEYEISRIRKKEKENTSKYVKEPN
jgi:hypothetical protein